jgi:chromosome segregation ATPase
MNLVGKILTGLIALFSIVFMTLVLAVYATHTNWRDVARNRETERDQVRKEKDDAQTKLTELQKAYDLEKTAWANVASAERDWRKTLQQKNDDQKKILDKVDTERAAALTTLDITQNNETDLFAQVHGGKSKDGKEHKGLLNEVTAEQTARRAISNRAANLQDQVQQLQNVLATLKNRQQTLVADAQRYRDILLQNNLSLNLDEKAAPDVQGRVTAVSGTGLVEIDIGRDAGLRQGQQLHVYRAAGLPYLGKLEVVETQPERAVCKVLPEFKKGPIQRDDHVAAQIRFQ